MVPPPTVKQADHPFACRWIERAGKRGARLSNWTTALCVRPPRGPRPVTVEECARCKFWEAESEPKA